MAIDVVPVSQQARANGLMWGAKTIGASLSLVVGTALINTVGFSTAIGSLSMVVAAIMMVPVFSRERPGEKFLPWTKGRASTVAAHSQLTSWKEIFKNLLKVVALPSSIIMGLAIFIGSLMFGLIDTALPVFTIQKLGWTNTTFSHLYSITTIIGGFLGMLVGGVLVDFFGKIKMMSIYLISMVLLIAAFPIFPTVWSINLVIYGFVLLYYVLYTFLCISVFAAAMQLCWKTVAATQFTLYMALSNMGRASGSGLLGLLKNNMSWQYVFLAIALTPFFMLILIQFINLLKHKESMDQFKTDERQTSLLTTTAGSL